MKIYLHLQDKRIAYEILHYKDPGSIPWYKRIANVFKKHKPKRKFTRTIIHEYANSPIEFFTIGRCLAFVAKNCKKGARGHISVDKFNIRFSVGRRTVVLDMHRVPVKIEYVMLQQMMTFGEKRVHLADLTVVDPIRFERALPINKGIYTKFFDVVLNYG